MRLCMIEDVSEPQIDQLQVQHIAITPYVSEKPWVARNGWIFLNGYDHSVIFLDGLDY